MKISPEFVILISADAEWKVVVQYFQAIKSNSSPYGEWFTHRFDGLDQPVVFFHGGWGKVAAAGSTQYAISSWQPRLVVNIGTCGGIEGEIERGMIILANETLIYDIYEQMGDPDEHIQKYVTRIDNSWLEEPFPIKVAQKMLVSGDRDLFCREIPDLKSKYGAVAGDWESGAIAWVASKNKTRCLILRGVTDLVSEAAGEAYNGSIEFFINNTKTMMVQLLDSVPAWLTRYSEFIATMS